MYNNKQHKTRNSGRFNIPGKFVPAAEQQEQQEQQSNPAWPQPPQPPTKPQKKQKQKPQQQQSEEDTFIKPEPQAPEKQQRQRQQSEDSFTEAQDTDTDMKVEQCDDADSATSSKLEGRPAWMKSKLGGVRKISNKERRRRQNQTLRRLLSPKNALMVLNEMVPHDQVINQFKVDPAQNQFFTRNAHNYCADLTLEGVNYKGYGDNKLSARNSAAEQAIRDLIIKKMNKVILSDVSSVGGSTNGEEVVEEEESLPMIQLASFALHKLFTEWECAGHKVPHLRPTGASVSEAASEAGAGAEMDADAEAEVKPKPKKKKAAGERAVPENAAAMHPCMLLTYMRPRLEYRDMAAAGDRPQNMVFTVGVEVDGATYIGKAGNKKEARRNAARAACSAIFNVHFDEPAPAPLHA